MVGAPNVTHPTMFGTSPQGRDDGTVGRTRERPSFWTRTIAATVAGPERLEISVVLSSKLPPSPSPMRHYCAVTSTLVHGSRQSLALPEGSHYVITYGIGLQFAGMTTALLFRSKCFAEISGTPVTIVTYDQADYDVIRQDLAQRGLLAPGVSIVNLFEDLGTWPDEALRSAHDSPGFHMDEQREVGHLGAHGTAHLRDHFRADGSRLLQAQRTGQVDESGLPVDTFTLFDNSGAPIGAWSSERDLLQFWLDSLPREPTAWFIIDHWQSATLLADYQRDDVVKMHLVHNRHLADGSTTELNSRRYVMERLDNFDAVAFLTDTQLNDVKDLLGEGSGNCYVVSNACIVPESIPTSRHRRNRGVVLGRLVSAKRIDHAIAAVAANADVVNPFNRPYLDIYGAGSTEDSLRRRISTVEARPRTALRRFLARYLGETGARAIAACVHRLPTRPVATLHGYRANGREEFRTAGFSMLTSKSEGCPLVIVESMGRGCIPICYDVTYGPAEIITHGVDGFLVPEGDQAALARTVRRVVTMKTADLERMRQAAFTRSQDFTGPSVVAKWASVMESAKAQKARKLSPSL